MLAVLYIFAFLLSFPRGTDLHLNSWNFH